MPTELAPGPASTTAGLRRFLVVWQHPDTRIFHPVANLRMLREEDGTHSSWFEYLPEAHDVEGFEAFLAFRDLDQSYEREGDLFPFVSNRVMSPRREDFGQYIDALGIDPGDADPIEILARSAGNRATDTIHIVPTPERTGDVEWRRFLVSGVRHQPDANELMSQLSPGDELQLRADPDNPHDDRAMLLDATEGRPVGWLPGYLLTEFHGHLDAGHAVSVTVEKVNGSEVPWHLRLLCRLEFHLT